MGLVFSRRKKERSSKEILEALEDSIKLLTESKRRNAQYERSFVSYLLILSFFIYLIGLLIFYLYFLPTTWLEGVLYGGPFVLFPVIVYLIKKLLNIYFFHRTTQFDAQLRLLHEEKRKTLNEVMEKETYKTARELLEKYDPSNPSLHVTPSRQPRRSSSGEGEVRRRRQPQTPHPAFMPQNIAMATPQPPRPPIVNTATPAPNQVPPTPGAPPPSVSANQVPPTTGAPPSASTNQVPPTTGVPPSVMATPQPSLQHIPPGMCVGAAPGPPTPCPILPRERTNVDKMVEYLVGDGPNNRYALICSECKSHNGMALRDEFEYLTFRCAYCYTLNQARKKRPTLVEPPKERPRSVSGENADQATEEDGNQGDRSNNSNSQLPSRHRHRSRGQRSSSQSSEGAATPTE